MIDLRIDKSEDLSINVQLTEQLKYQIQSGKWPPRFQLPTVRDLAATLRLNYNTIRAAYQELERQGYLVNEQGRGTFVARNPPRMHKDQHESLVELLDEALSKVQLMGVSTEDFARLAYTRAKLFTPKRADVMILFTECNTADLDHFTRSIERTLGVQPFTLLLSQLQGRRRQFFNDFDLLVTTVSHVSELQDIVGPDRSVLGLMYEPSYIDVLNDIIQLPSETRVGLICPTKDAAKNREKSLLERGVKHLRFITAGIENDDEIKKVFHGAQQIYVSRIIINRLTKRQRQDKRVHEYVTELDPEALRLLRREISRVVAGRTHAGSRRIQTSRDSPRLQAVDSTSRTKRIRRAK